MTSSVYEYLLSDQLLRRALHNFENPQQDQQQLGALKAESARYYHQLTKGCGNNNCVQPLCASCRNGIKLGETAALSLALQLAASGDSKNACPNRAEFPSSLSKPAGSGVWKEGKISALLFWNNLLGCSPFSWLKPPSISFNNSEGYHLSWLYNAAPEGSFIKGAKTPSIPPSKIAVAGTGAVGTTLAPLKRSFSRSLHVRECLSYWTLALLQRVAELEFSPDLEEPLFLKESLKFVFGNLEALNQSFSPSSTPSSSEHPSGISLSQVCGFYQLLEELENQYEGLIRVMLDSANGLIIQLCEKYNETGDAIGNEGLSLLKGLFILFLIYTLAEDRLEVRSRPLIRLLALIQASRLSQSLQNWLERLSFADFERAVRFCHLSLSDSFHQNPLMNWNDNASNSVLLVNLLWKANQGRDKTLPEAAFINISLCQRLDIRYAYQRKFEKCRARNQLHYLDYPYLLDCERKSQLFRMDVITQMSASNASAQAYQQSLSLFRKLTPATSGFATRLFQHPARYQVKIDGHLTFSLRRDKMASDFLELISLRLYELGKPLRIRYVQGGEEGLDQGGLQKEFFQEAGPQLFDPSYGMFSYNEQTRLRWFCGHSLAPLSNFELLGTFMGLALYNGVVMDLGFPLVFWKKLLGQTYTLDDFSELEPEIGRGFQSLLDWEEDNVEDVFCLNFEISETSNDGLIKNFELKQNGSSTPVTLDNRSEFVELYMKRILDGSPQKQFEAFKNGFYRVCNEEVLRIFSAKELRDLAGGSSLLDFHALEQSTEYEDGYSRDHLVIRYLWAIIHNFNMEQKRAFLRFVTACDRAPPGGLGKLRFYVLRNGPDSERLPTSYTCFNRLLLPEYASKEKMRERLLVAIEHGVGFGLV